MIILGHDVFRSMHNTVDARSWMMWLCLVFLVLVQQGLCQAFDTADIDRVSGAVGEGYSARQDLYTIRESIGRLDIDVTNYFVDTENFEVSDNFVVNWHLKPHRNVTNAATPGVDVTPTKGFIVFAKEKSVRTITLDIETNDGFEKDETFVLHLTSDEQTALPHLKEFTTVKIIQDETCNGISCTADAICGNLTCDCKENYIGDPRFTCVDPGKHHLCIEYGDPQIQPMGGHPFYLLLLPCEHRIVETETETGCSIIINGASTDETYDLRAKTKLEMLNITIVKDNQLTYLAINENGTEFSDKIAMKFARNDEGFLEIALPECDDAKIKFREEDGAVVVELPKHTFLPIGACMPSDAPEAPGSSYTVREARGKDLVEMFLHSVHEIHSFYPLCKDISATYSSCESKHFHDMSIVCGQFAFGDSGECLSKGMDRQQFLSVIHRCMDDICINNLHPCDAIKKYITATNARCDIDYVLEDYGCPK
ncbi:uncharacterized protein LOC124150829 [Haliotis rufescens]|uniref:uncharacterized protein LOC124150829 n=1 Tax=Haliotis rufescens TaxID=6454 RepID=UPI00201EFA7B|nr:uncharacterized protein LOC124150829 [Haliotis rufescens]